MLTQQSNQPILCSTTSVRTFTHTNIHTPLIIYKYLSPYKGMGRAVGCVLYVTRHYRTYKAPNFRVMYQQQHHEEQKSMTCF